MKPRRTPDAVRRSPLAPLLLGLLGALAACGGGGGAAPPASEGPGEEPSRCASAERAAESTWAALSEVVFAERGCTTLACHGAAPGAGNLDLRADVAYRSLVDVRSSASTLDRVEPGDEELSLLWLKLAAATRGRDGVPGAPMPLGLGPVPDAELDALELWIRAGAPETGVVPGTADLLGRCLPAEDPPKIRAPEPPGEGIGVQLHAPPWDLPPNSESEVCYATWYDLSAEIPADHQAPCPDAWGGPERDCFFYRKIEHTSDASTHHAIVRGYTGSHAPDDPAFGSFTCLGGTRAGSACNPLGVGIPAPDGADCGPGGGCAGERVPAAGCLGYGPPDLHFNIFAGRGSDVGTTGPEIIRTQEPIYITDYGPGAYAMLPVAGLIIWDAHAFNLTDKPGTNEQWLNIEFAPPGERSYAVVDLMEASDIFVTNVPAFERREYCRTTTLPRGARLIELTSHTHKRGTLFRAWGPGIAESCSSATDPPCEPEDGEPVFVSTNPADANRLTFTPPLVLDSEDEADRTFKFCGVFDNGATDPATVKRRSLSPSPPGDLPLPVGGPCGDDTVSCLDGPRRGQPCSGDDRACDSAPGTNDGVCDACPLRGGVTTEDEMFILSGFYYVVQPADAASAAAIDAEPAPALARKRRGCPVHVAR